LNGPGGFYLVRNSDAHAWSEVWLSGRGWVRIDPTAAVAPERIQRGSISQLRAAQAWYAKGGLWHGIRQRFELAGYWWNRAVVQYSALRQRDLLQSLGLGQPSTEHLAIALIVSVFFALGLVAYVARLGRRAPGDRMIVAYRAYCARLAQLGVTRHPNEGPAAFAQRAATALPGVAADIGSISREFIQLRYGSESPAEDAVRNWARRAGRVGRRTGATKRVASTS
jgi:hypothetical protein